MTPRVTPGIEAGVRCDCDVQVAWLGGLFFSIQIDYSLS
jgi:hypothetical protein